MDEETRRSVEALLAVDLAGSDHVPDLEIIVELYARMHGPEDDYTLAEKVAALARVWIHRDAELIEAIRRGEHLPTARLAELMRCNTTLPRVVRDYIAGRMEGSIKPRGRPTPRYDPEHTYQHAVLQVAALLVRQEHERNKAEGMKGGKPGSSDPYRAALHSVSLETGIPEDTLDKHVYPRKKRRRR